MAAYHLLRGEPRNYFLILVSLFFYSWGEGCLVVILISSILGNYVLGLLVASVNSRFSQKLVLALAVILNLGLIGYYKYITFLLDSINISPLYRRSECDQSYAGPFPIGISFFTFQALSYVIDVYRGEIEAQPNPSRLGLVMSLFPHQIAGPIVRYKDIMDEVVSRRVSWDSMKRYFQTLYNRTSQESIVSKHISSYC